MKKLNLKQPKYIFPLVIFLPLAFVAYELTNVFGGKATTSKVATDSLNMEIPSAQNAEMEGKMASMEGRIEGDNYTAVDGFDTSEDGKDTISSGYSESEKDRIDQENAERLRQQRAREEMERTLAAQSSHINSYAGAGSSYRGGSSSSRRDDLDDYAKELEYIQKRSLAAQRAIDGGSNYDDYGSADYDGSHARQRKQKKGRGTDPDDYNINTAKEKDAKPEVVKKVQRKNADKFNTISSRKDVDAPLIRAMIDKTTKAHEGTRLRFKLLDDVTIDKVLLKKGTYLYGLVTGFGQQRVRASITSILVRNKFIKVNLSVYDNDGMEGFYVPESAFRDLMKNAGSQAMQSNMQLDNGYGGSSLTGESVALQALQNIYQSASNAVSANIRKNKARIKYNTIVYLINTNLR